MGSLPNLHELDKHQQQQQHHQQQQQQQAQQHQRIGPCLSNPHQHSILTNEERQRILHRHSTHNKCKTRVVDIIGREQQQRAVLQHQHSQQQHDCIEQNADNSPPKKRTSLNSSIGATSIHRLLITKPSSQHQPHAQTTYKRQLIGIAVLNFIHCTIFAPFWPLAASGALVITTAHSSAHLMLLAMNAGGLFSSLIAVRLLAKLRVRLTMALSGIATVAFLLVHIVPPLNARWWVLAPSYFLLGACLAVAQLSKIIQLLALVGKFANRTIYLRKFTRLLQLGSDGGLIVGSVLSFALIILASPSSQSRNRNLAVALLDDDEEPSCGAFVCSSTMMWHDDDTNNTLRRNLLLIVYVVIALIGLLGTFWLRDGGGTAAMMVTAAQHHHHDHDANDGWWWLVLPLECYVGMGEAFMYADFSKSYVVCTLGVERLNLVFFTMGLLQSVAACTLSMFLRNVRRYVVIIVGFTFQACLLMLQLIWKPNADDPALFYVISATWGVCNAVWQLIVFTHLTFGGDHQHHHHHHEERGSATAPRKIAFTQCVRFAGAALMLGAHELLCNWMKIYLLAVGLVAGVATMLYGELKKV